MGEVSNSFLILVILTITLIGGMIAGFALEGDKRIKIDCRIELGRSGRTVAEIVEICK